MSAEVEGSATEQNVVDDNVDVRVGQKIAGIRVDAKLEQGTELSVLVAAGEEEEPVDGRQAVLRVDAVDAVRKQAENLRVPRRRRG